MLPLDDPRDRAIEPWEKYGPNGKSVIEFVELIRAGLDEEQTKRLGDAHVNEHAKLDHDWGHWEAMVRAEHQHEDVADEFTDELDAIDGPHQHSQAAFMQVHFTGMALLVKPYIEPANYEAGRAVAPRSWGLRLRMPRPSFGRAAKTATGGASLLLRRHWEDY